MENSSSDNVSCISDVMLMILSTEDGRLSGGLNETFTQALLPTPLLKHAYSEYKCNFIYSRKHREWLPNLPSRGSWQKRTTNFTINWSILATAPAYSNKSKRCHLCLTEKLYLIRGKKPSLLNKRKELISKCRHENKCYSANFTSRQQ